MNENEIAQAQKHMVLAQLSAGILTAIIAADRYDQDRKVPEVLREIYDGLTALEGPAKGEVPEGPVYERATPGQVRKSITDDHLVSFVDGRHYKTLRRHLARHGLDEKAYRERYGLPSDYPMVAKAYSEQRRELARQLGLGQRVKAAPATKGRKKAAS